MKSSHAIIVISLVWLWLGYSFYPKWEKPGSEATISWDVSGYYHYLPAIFIYKDIRQQNWMNAINEKYLPSPAYDQAFGHQNSGNKVNKYFIGQAVMYTPFFLVGHAYANMTGTYPADGYSKPYQISIWLGSLLISILGLILLQKILLHYFDDRVVLWTLLAIGLGTHWMEYASITNGMNHTWLFALLCVLILSTIRFYKKSDRTSILGISLSLGLAVLTRPTEFVWVLVPLLWGITTLSQRFSFLLLHWKKIFIAVVISGLIVLIQPIYWKYVSGEWIVYSYGDQGFNWLHPAIKKGLLGANIGWWIYTPMMLLAFVGWFGLYKKHRQLFWAVFSTSLLAIYITLSWSHFESGGGLGQRNLIQIYPLLAFPLAVVIGWFNKSVVGRWIWVLILSLNIYYTGWWIYQAHKGGFFQVSQMNRKYILNVAGRLHPDKDLLKLLDTPEYFKDVPKSMTAVYQNDFDLDTTFCSIPLPSGGKAACVKGDTQFYGPVSLPVTPPCGQWIRLEADFNVQSREWDVWKYAQWIVQFHQGDKVVKSNFIRVHRLITTDQVDTPVFFDVKIPDQPYDRCTMLLWNAESPQTLLMDNLKVSCFSER